MLTLEFETMLKGKEMKARAYEIDLLRFIAALSVVFFHYGFRGYIGNDQLTVMPYLFFAPLAQYGYLGVDLFFVISGFVILMTALNSNLKTFFASRVARLYPAFWVCCTLTFLTIAVLGAPQHHASFNQYLFNMTMLSAFLNVPAVDGSYWSLFVEIRFYVLVAALIAIGAMGRVEFILVLWTIATAFLNAHKVGVLNFILISDYAAHFIAGAIFFLVWSRGLNLQRSFILILCWLMVMRHSLNEVPQLEQHFGKTFNPYVICSLVSIIFLIMLLVATKKTGIMRTVNWTLVGALTYPLYLIHQTVGYIIFNSAYPFLSAHIVFWGTLLLMLAIAYWINTRIEAKYAGVLKRCVNEWWERTISLRFSKKGS